MLPMLNVIWGGNIIESWDYNINIFGDFSLLFFFFFGQKEPLIAYAHCPSAKDGRNHKSKHCMFN